MPTTPAPLPHDLNAADPAAGSPPVRLTELGVGDRGRLHATVLVVDDQEILHALGLAERSRFQVRKAGDPWILQVRATRIGMSPAIAAKIMVIPEP